MEFWLLWPLWLYLIFEILVVMIFLAWIQGDLYKLWRWLKGSLHYHFGRKAMLDRIAELEKARTEPLAVLIGLDSKMLHGKQRFRSPAAKEIHANIRFAIRELLARGLTTDPNSSVAWMQNFEKPEAKVLR